ncbi:Transport protein particle (TRAPP) complex subunit [Plasmopara halstedii]|uniref:Trafficking protein particle complex subunit n=1 Tax=Plasmopara halstedii TaxID=4781 RepID=A0A0P1AHW7_PLAHL|nr:Transport protein particle (TRAPP) complex subunit [Plasmopara halstedii]CEG40581.1 Transport protein particle (TRAPP) complex subunit [Plasmopara halstedii]|eukprot:XP_024576950.1 Transport protein particle (TRAPP) complex subunit [Plasmopara halstedii]
MSTPRPYQRLGDAAWNKMSKVNGELFALTYGALVTQLIKDFEDLKIVNEQLDKMGYNIGVRLVDEFLAKSGVNNCQDFRDTSEVVAKVAFKMFLGINVEVSQWNTTGTACSLLIHDNPLTEFVELPPSAYGVLWYSNVLCGVLRGALEMVQMRVDAQFVKDVLQGDEVSEIRLELKGMIEEAMGDEYKED